MLFSSRPLQPNLRWNIPLIYVLHGQGNIESGTRSLTVTFWCLAQGQERRENTHPSIGLFRDFSFRRHERAVRKRTKSS